MIKIFKRNNNINKNFQANYKHLYREEMKLKIKNAHNSYMK